MRKIILFQSQDQAIYARKFASQTPNKYVEGVTCGVSAFGTTFTTPLAYLADAWELWGDDREIIDASTRSAIMTKALAETNEFSISSGSVKLFTEFVEWVSGTPALDNALSNTNELQNFNDLERKFLDVVSAYFALLDKLGKIEPGQAAAFLNDFTTKDQILFACNVNLAPAISDFFKSQNAAFCTSPSAESDASSVRSLNPNCECKFAFSGGPLSIHSALLDEVNFAIKNGCNSILICCSDPNTCFETLAPHLSSNNCNCVLKSSTPFEQTSLGRAILAAYELCSNDAYWLENATDFAYSKFSCISKAAVQALNTRFRSDRTYNRISAMNELAQISPTFGAMREFSSSAPGDFEIKFTTFIESLNATSKLTAEDAALCQKCTQLCALFDKVTLDMPFLIESFKNISASSTLKAAPAASKATVVFMSLAQAKNLPDQCFDAVIIDDASSNSIHPKTKLTSLDALISKLGIRARSTSEDMQLESFNGAIAAARKYFICALIQRTSKQAETFSSYVLDGLVKNITSATSNPGNPDKSKFNIPQNLIANAFEVAEDDFIECIAKNFETANSSQIWPAATRGSLNSVQISDYLSYSPSDTVKAHPLLSPSAIETYISCPYRWFIERKIRISDIDEAFDARAKGTFSHMVLQKFFENLPSHLNNKLTEEWLETPEAQNLFDSIFSECVSLQNSLSFDDARLVAITHSEELEIQKLQIQLYTTLNLLAKLPAQYNVYAQEFEISLDDNVIYAGAQIIGRADRVDTSPDAQKFAIIDYKGSLMNHSAGFSEKDTPETFALPGKIQALIYAQCMKSIFAHAGQNLKPACAIYASYNAKTQKSFVAGSIDEASYFIDGISGSNIVNMNFEEFLNLVESLVVPYISSLQSGNIAPEPKSDKSCNYCAYNLQCAKGN
jgi:hypothetical protein